MHDDIGLSARFRLRLGRLAGGRVCLNSVTGCELLGCMIAGTRRWAGYCQTIATLTLLDCFAPVTSKYDSKESDEIACIQLSRFGIENRLV